MPAATESNVSLIPVSTSCNNNNNPVNQNATASRHKTHEIQSATFQSLQGHRFSPFAFTVRDANRVKLGVPSGTLYSYSSASVFVCSHWYGSAPHLLTHSYTVCTHILIFVCFLLAGTLVQDTQVHLLFLTIPNSLVGCVSSLAVFAPVFFLNQVSSRWYTRFERVIHCNGKLRSLIGLIAGSGIPKPQARAMIRYSNALMSISYFLIAGPMKDEQWEILIDRGGNYEMFFDFVFTNNHNCV